VGNSVETVFEHLMTGNQSECIQSSIQHQNWTNRYVVLQVIIDHVAWDNTCLPATSVPLVSLWHDGQLVEDHKRKHLQCSGSIGVEAHTTLESSHNRVWIKPARRICPTKR
jgi:hypothetical protein